MGVLGQYHTTPPTLPNQGQEPLQMDSRGNLKVTLVGGDSATGGSAVNPTPSGATAQAPSNAQVVAYVASKVVKASAGTLYGFSIYNSKGSAQFVQLHNATALPADTSVPVWVGIVPATSNLFIDFGAYGRRFTTGIVIANSSTGPTLSIGSADLWIDAQYV